MYTSIQDVPLFGKPGIFVTIAYFSNWNALIQNGPPCMRK